MDEDFLKASQNQIKRWSRLLEAKFRQTDGLFLAEGVKVVEELFKSNWHAETILVLPDKKSCRQDRLLTIPNQTPVFQLCRADFKKLSQDKEPDGILAVVRKKESPDFSSWLASRDGHLLIAHEISNPQNLGALIRSAGWFGFSGIVLSRNSVDWTHPKVIRASMGAVFSLPLFSDVNLDDRLAEIEKKFLLIGSDVREGVPPDFEKTKSALLVGSESHGLPEHLLKRMQKRWCIPGGGRVESLSLPQAAAVMMYAMTQKV